LITELRKFQIDALATLKKPGHLICVSATGSGKSLIYERRALQARTRTLLVTPLVALARQQKERLQNTGLKVCLGSGNAGEGPPDQKTAVWIISPEMLEYSTHRHSLEKWKPDFLVVDECHCLWEWSDRFRPSFELVPKLIKDYQIPQSLWLTATLPFPARENLRKILPAPLTEQGSFELPPKLHLSALKTSWMNRPASLIGWMNYQHGPGIVFVSTREAAHRVAALIQAGGRNAIAYHAGLSREERVGIEARVAAQKNDVLVATSAFGMGMNHPHLKWVALWQAPPSLLSLAQTIGRVGRSSTHLSRALVLWDSEDFRLLEWMIQESPRRRSELIETFNYLSRAQCRREGLKSYFDRQPSYSVCGLCDYCIQVKDAAQLH
jgi:ATP-dependent DNA helicase RecQ